MALAQVLIAKIYNYAEETTMATKSSIALAELVEKRVQNDIVRELRTAQKSEDRARLVPFVGAHAARSIAAAVAAQRREELRATIEGEREDVRSSSRFERTVCWREFVTECALAGDEAAISALRGLRYQDGREQRRRERDGLAAQGGATEPQPRSLCGLA